MKQKHDDVSFSIPLQAVKIVLEKLHSTLLSILNEPENLSLLWCRSRASPHPEYNLSHYQILHGYNWIKLFFSKLVPVVDDQQNTPAPSSRTA